MTGPTETLAPTKSARLQGLIYNYYTLWTLQGWSYYRAECYCKSDEKLSFGSLKLPKVQFTKNAIQHDYQSHNQVQQSSDTQQQYERSRYQW